MARQREREAKGSPLGVASTPLAAGHRWLSVATAGNAGSRRPLSPTSGGPYRRQASVLVFSQEDVPRAAHIPSSPGGVEEHQGSCSPRRTVAVSERHCG